MTDAALDEVIAHIPLLDGITSDQLSITRVAGFTNDNYRLSNEWMDWILRIPRPATDQFIDRDAEAHNQDLACELEIAPVVAWRNQQGVTLTPVLQGTRSLRHQDFASDDSLQRLLAVLRTLHRSQLLFRGRVDLKALLHQYFGLLKPGEQATMQPRLDQALLVLAGLEGKDSRLVPSHNDLVLENLLIDDHGDKVWLIDWEYSSMASPYWDLATLCNAADLDYQQSRKLMRIYCAGGSMLDESVLFDYRGLLKLLGDCWMATLAG